MFALSRPAAALRRLAGATPPSHLPRRTVRLRLTAMYGCLFLLSGAGLLAITNLAVAHQSARTAFYISRGNGTVQTHIQGVIGGFSAPVGLTQLAVPTHGAVPPAPSRTESTRVAAAPSRAAHAGSAHGASARGGPVLAAGESPVAVKALNVATPQQLRAQARQLTTLASRQSSEELHHLLITSAIVLGFMALISLALGWLISGRALRPMDEAFEAQRRFVANASHELRTPLAMMRTSLDVAVAKPGAPSPQLQALERKLREGLDQAERLVEGFLTLARAQQGAPPEQNHVSLSHVARAAIEAHSDAAAERSVEVRAAIGGDVRVAGSEMLLRRMLDNVIDNAIRHNKPGGWVRIAIENVNDGRRGRDGRAGVGTTGIVVENGGPRLRADAVAELAQPFRRLGAARTGSQDGHGLGLSIVAAIAAAHGGTLDLYPRAEGGLRIVIGLPHTLVVPHNAEPTAGAGAGLPAGAPS
jgi:signal transduction histidine kinase